MGLSCSDSVARRRILVAMSGGVDSSAAALLLRERGVEVVGCTMRLWDYRRNPLRDGHPQFGSCCSLDDVYDARRVAEQFGFPFYVLNLEEEFERRVIEPFIEGYLSGETPLPCTLCNTFLKFDRLLVFARQVGIERVATGHYARVQMDSDGKVQLWKGLDESKDQSYYLFELTQEQLAHTEFPVGEFRKPEIREISRRHGLATADKPESQEICFVPDRDYAGFIRRHTGEINPALLPVLQEREREGPIQLQDGTRLGTHGGIHLFTVGQRKGLGIAHAQPLYVLRLEPSTNTVIVGYQEDLYSRGLVAHRLNWIAGHPPAGSFEAEVKIRSRHRQARCEVALEVKEDSLGSSPRARVVFAEPQMAVTPGQAAVFYKGDRVLGGGWIERRIS